MTAVALQEAAWTPLADALPRLESLVSPLVGVVHDVHELYAAPHEARLFRFAATTAAMHLAFDRSTPDLEETSGGYAADLRRARAAAIGEAAERYAGCILPAHLPLAAADELPGAVDPRRFALFAPEQHARPGFPFEPFLPSTPVRWTRGFSVPDGRAALLPSQLVHLSTWGRQAAGEARVGYSTSSGLACGPSLEEAVLAALLEAVERDAFMLAWDHRLSLPLLDGESDPRLTAFAARYLTGTAAGWRLVDLSVFADVPVVLAVVEGAGELDPALAVGAGAAATAADAAEKALAEAFAVRSWGRSLTGLERSRRHEPDFADIVTFRDHIALYTRAELAPAAAFLTASSSRRPLDDVPPLTGTTPLAQLREIAGRLAERDVTVYAADLTPPDLSAAGLAVAKVIAPELCPLDVRHDARFLGGERMRRAPFELGLTCAPAAWDELNPYPHPFP